MATLDIILNGKPYTVAENTTLQQLLENLSLHNKRIAVEMDGRIVPRGLHAGTALAPGSQLEIVGAVGGG